MQSPFHRSTALQLHNELLSIPSIHTAITETINLGLLPGTQNRDILGSWLVAALEEGRRAGGSGIRVFEETFYLSPSSSIEEETKQKRDQQIDLEPLLSSLLEYLSLSILDPVTLHEDIHPPPVSINTGSSSPTPSARVMAKATKVRPSSFEPTSIPGTPATEDEEVEAERWARYRVAGIVGLTWLIQKISSSQMQLPLELLALLRNPVLWTSLSPVENPTILDHFSTTSSMCLGYQQPPIRRVAYTLLGVMIDSWASEIEKQDLLELLSVAVLSSCWLEKEAIVWDTAGPAVVKFLNSTFSLIYPSIFRLICLQTTRCAGRSL